VLLKTTSVLYIDEMIAQNVVAKWAEPWILKGFGQQPPSPKPGG